MRGLRLRAGGSLIHPFVGEFSRIKLGTATRELSDLCAKLLFLGGFVCELCAEPADLRILLLELRVLVSGEVNRSVKILLRRGVRTLRRRLPQPAD